MADEPNPRVFALPFNVPESVAFGQPIAWITIATDELGKTYLNYPQRPDVALILVAEAVRLINLRIADQLRATAQQDGVTESQTDPGMIQGQA